MAKDTFVVKGKNEKLSIYPIGAIYMSMSSDNPSIYFGGTWEQVSNGRVLVGIDESQPEFKDVRKTGGEKTHKLTAQELPGSITVRENRVNSYGNNDWGGPLTGWGNYQNDRGNNVVSDSPHNNMPPYLTCYIWERIA